MTYTRTLNDAQTAVLRWIADGCPDGVMEGYEHRISAAALRARDLVRVSGHGKTWRAEITDRGREFLTRPPADDVERTGARSSRQRSTREEGRQLAPPKIVPPRRLSPTEQLVADVIAAGGALRVPSWRREGEPDYQQRVLAAQRFHKVPSGKRLTTHYVDGQTEIRLEDAIEGTEVEARPVPVPQRVSRLHSVASGFRDDTNKHAVSRAALARCVRVIHALATEAERRGYEISNVGMTTGDSRGERRSAADAGHLIITIRAHSYRLRVSEGKVTTRGVFDKETRYRASVAYPQYLRPRKTTRYDSEGTGRLQITSDGYGRGGRASTWADRRSWTLEEKLPELLQELEIRAAEDDHRQTEEMRIAEERRHRWELAMESAREHFMEAHRAEVLREQVVAWQEARVLREYLGVLEGLYGESADATEWIEWIRAYVEHVDPLHSPPAMPERPEISPEDLKPFLGGLSPHGPSRW
jgi:hypothetical protein